MNEDTTEKLQEGINNILIKISEINGKLDTYKSDIERHTKMIEELYNDRNKIKEKLTTLETRSESCKNQYVSKDEFTKYEKEKEKFDSTIQTKINIIWAVFGIIGGTLASGIIGILIKVIIKGG